MHVCVLLESLIKNSNHHPKIILFNDDWNSEVQGCPLHGSVQNHVKESLEQPGLVEGASAHGGAVMGRLNLDNL